MFYFLNTGYYRKNNLANFRNSLPSLMEQAPEAFNIITARLRHPFPSVFHF